MKRRNWLESLLLIAGLVAVNVWIWSHAVTAIYQRWEERQFQRVQPQSGQRPAPRPSVAANSRLGRLIIPRLHLHAMVREGTGEGTLGLAVGHIPNTALPGEKGNVGLAAHRDTLFRGLKDIRQNDLIQFETLSGNHSYRVETTRIVKPEDVSVLKPGPAPELTLVTCYPFHYIGNAPERFIVKAREVKARETVQESAARPQPNAKPPQPRAKLPQPNAKKRPAHVQRRKSRRVELAAIARPDWR